ncbi:MAG: flippase [Candidatus Paceibacterota bacterium]
MFDRLFNSLFNIVFDTLRRILPPGIHTRLKGTGDREGFKKYFKNTGWLLAARVITFALSFFTVAFVARYLGPENYGKLSYAQSFVAIFSIFASLGIDQILYRDLIAHPEREHELLGTALFSKIFFGILAFLVTITVAAYSNHDVILTFLIFIVSLTFIFQPLGVLASYFSAKVHSKYYSYLAIVLAFVLPALRLLIIFFHKGILFFAGVIVFESVAYSAFYLYIYVTRFHGKPFSWTFSFNTFKQLFHDSWPLLLAGLSGYVYGRIDQVMIKQYMDVSSVGLYDAAVKITEMWAFLPGIIIGSLFPAIVNARSHDRSSYSKRLRALSFLTLGISTVISLLIFVGASFIIDIVFGSQFLGSVGILRIYIWTGVGTVGIALIQNYLVAERRGRWFFGISLFGAVTNILFNLFLIPHFATAGAAFATVFSYILMILAFFFILRRTRSADDIA